MNALKRELSLDLHPIQPRLPAQKNRAATLPVKDQLQAAASPNTSNFTDNTSQSVTPSEFGYQHLQRHLSMHSLLATDESSPVYEDFEQQTPVKLPVTTSPIKSTISITYKSPEKEKKLLLETNFDENIVYEQVKLFRNSVTEVNQMLHERTSLKQIDEEEQHQDVGAFKAAEMTHQLLQLEQEHQQHQHQGKDEEQSHLLYENIELRKPQTVYENLRGEEMKFNIEKLQKSNSDRIELDSLDSLPDNMEHEHEHEHELELTPSSKSPSFSVKELANKFESSPVEQLPSFDFSVRGGSMKKPNELSVPKAMPPAPVPLKKLNCSAQQKITRSLDENAFVREFGGKHLQDLSSSGKLLPETPIPECINSRRKSFDFTRPKMLNPPKRLPGMSITEEVCQQRGIEPEQITPTTENRISLIQLNNGPKEQQQLLPPVGRKSVLTGVVLDRERIDKIKEERRLQLTQKYYGDILKSRSRTELNAEDTNCQQIPVAESLRIKSKSRGDINALQNDMDINLKQMTLVAGGGSESTLHQGNGQALGQQRMCCISDEKKQNCDTSSNGGFTSGVSASGVLSVKTAAKNFGSTAKQAPPPPNKFEQRGHPALPRERLQRNSVAESSPVVAAK